MSDPTAEMAAEFVLRNLRDRDDADPTSRQRPNLTDLERQARLVAALHRPTPTSIHDVDLDLQPGTPDPDGFARLNVAYTIWPDDTRAGATAHATRVGATQFVADLDAVHAGTLTPDQVRNPDTT